MSENVERFVEEYIRHQEHLDMLQKNLAVMKAKLVVMVEDQGEADEKGNQWLQVGRYMLQRQRREGQRSLNNERATAWAKDRGIWDEVKVVVETLDEDSLLGYVFDNRHEEGLEEEFQTLYDSPKVTFAFMRPVEEQSYDY